MMKIKKIISMAISSALVVGILGSCSNSDESSSDDNKAVEPTEYYNGESVDTGYEWGNVEIEGGGYVPNIIYNPTEEGLTYARTDIGGAYRLNSETNRWECITDCIGGEDWNYMGIESIATDPIEPNRVYFAGGTYTTGNGAIFYSDDYGENWGIYELPFGCGGNEVGRGAGERLQVDPNDNSILYFGTRANGLWKSADYGKTWAEVTSFPTTGGYVEDGYSIGLTFVAFDKASSSSGEATKTIIVGAAKASGNMILRSDDAGETWTEIENPTAITTKDKTDKLKPCQGEISSDGYLYSTWSFNVGPSNASRGAVQKYNLATGEWEDISPEVKYACGYNAISVNPNDPKNIVCMTLDLWAVEDNLFVTYDGGETWHGLWDQETKEKNYNLDITSSPWLDWQGQLKLGWWTSGVAINPFNSDEVLYGTGATIYGTTNLTKIADEKVDIEVRAMGIEETAIVDFVAPYQNDENAPALYSIMADIYGFRHDSVDVAPTEHFGDFRSTDIDCAAQDYKIVVKATAEGDGSLYYSTDSATTWTAVETLPEGIGEKAGGECKLSADGKTILYQPQTAGASAYITSDFGKTWTKCEGIPTNVTIESDKVNSNKFYAFYDGTFYMSEDGGKNFKVIASILLTNISIEACGDVEGELWISTGSGGVYFIDTNTAGAQVTKVGDGVTEATCIGLGKAETDDGYMALYIIGEANSEGHGVYRSTDKGQTWVRINDDTQQWGNVNSCISGDPKVFGRVYISTNGRGIIMGNVATE